MVSITKGQTKTVQGVTIQWIGDKIIVQNNNDTGFRCQIQIKDKKGAIIAQESSRVGSSSSESWTVPSNGVRADGHYAESACVIC